MKTHCKFFVFINLTIITVAYCFISCQQDRSSSELLTEAQNLVDSNSVEAIKVLESIHNPENMDKNDYMTYILLMSHATLNEKQPFTQDSLLLEAQVYFDNKSDMAKSTLVHFNLGRWYRKRKDNENAMKQFVQSEYLASKNENYLIAGKSSHFIGNLYFDKDQIDSAIVRYHKALYSYNKIEYSDRYKLQVITSIGRSYVATGESDSAYTYFNKVMQDAIETGNQEYVAYSTSNLGLVYRDKKEYSKASAYLHRALDLVTKTEDSLRIYLDLSILYNENGQLDSAQYYTGLIKERLSEIESSYILKTVYGTLADYNKHVNNINEAFRYKELEYNMSQAINETNNSIDLVAAETKYKQRIQEERIARLEMRTYLYVAIASFLAIFITIAAIIRNRAIRQKRKLVEEQNRVLEAENEILNQRIENYVFMQNIYEDIINGWTQLEQEVRSFADKHTSEDLETYGKLNKWMEHLSSIVNQKFIFAAKDFLKRETNGDVLQKLSDDDLLLFMLLYNGYTESEITKILGVELFEQVALDERMEQLRSNLIGSDIPAAILNKIGINIKNTN